MYHKRLQHFWCFLQQVNCKLAIKHSGPYHYIYLNLRYWKNLPFHITCYQLNHATIESLIRIVPYLSLVKKEQCLRCNSPQSGLENLAEGIAVIMVILKLIAWFNKLKSMKIWVLYKLSKFYKLTVLSIFHFKSSFHFLEN